MPNNQDIPKSFTGTTLQLVEVPKKLGYSVKSMGILAKPATFSHKFSESFGNSTHV